tara:strand:+ start:194 stop:979 length:786 start_codon:yes stop_codon:yes gene_type:complete
MNKKPWGILVPLKIQKIIYPKDKAEYERPYILSTISRRISVILSYYILNRSNISPNFVTFFSLIILFFCLIFFINSNYLIGSALACFWNILDNVDGELARLQNSSSNFGAFLEKLNSNFFYMILFPSLSIGLFRDGLINFDFVILTFFSLGFFIILRPFFDANFPYKKAVNKNSFLLIIGCQFKNSYELRGKSKLGSFIYYFWRNIFAQGGINEIFLVLLSLNSYLSSNLLPKALIFFSLGYFLINASILLSLLLYNMISK